MYVCVGCKYACVLIQNTSPASLWAGPGDMEVPHLCQALRFDNSDICSPYTPSRHSGGEEKGKATMAWFVSFSR